MKQIESFAVNHIGLQKGVYVSRKDVVANEIITTFDLRLKIPNEEPVLDNPALHAMEHLWATFLRSHDIYDEKTVYFGPMWCRTGFYVIFKWEMTSEEALPIIKELFNFMATFEWLIPWASAKECGNYLDMNLNMAHYESKEYLKTLNNIKQENINYPA